MQDFNLLSKNVEGVGRNIGQSKLKYTWRIAINGTTHVINVYHSRLSNKYELKIDGKSVEKKQNLSFKNVDFKFQISGHKLIVAASVAENCFKLIDTRDKLPDSMTPDVDYTKYSVVSDQYRSTNSNKNSINTNTPYKAWPSDGNGYQNTNLNRNHQQPYAQNSPFGKKNQPDGVLKFKNENVDKGNDDSGIFFDDDKNYLETK